MQSRVRRVKGRVRREDLPEMGRSRIASNGMLKTDYSFRPFVVMELQVTQSPKGPKGSGGLVRSILAECGLQSLLSLKVK